ncbi:MAG: hypothetical protein K6F33_03010 [Bacteroidales bacterium]|nr:hypothetical protein [Bacteroidales bacterium]
MTNFWRKYSAYYVSSIVVAMCMAITIPSYAQIYTAYPNTDTTMPAIYNDSIYLISDIIITGNKKTKPKTILCELEFEKGDTVSASRLPQIIEKSTTNLKKTSIFNYVTITYESDGDSLHTGLNCINININVEECWYTWPMFDISPHNGNLNEWVANPDFDLIDYHIGIKKYNFRGRREAISLLFKRGFNNITQIGYENIAIDRKRKHLISLFASVQKQNNVMINTQNDKALYHDFSDQEKAFDGYNYELIYKHRPSIDVFNTIGIGYMSAHIRDSVAIINPNFLGKGKSRIEGIILQYHFRLDKRNSSYYPLKGSYLTTAIKKYGLFSNTIDTYNLILDTRKYWQLASRQYFAAQLYGSTSSKSTPFHLMEAIGFKPNIVPGYEHNMIKGTSLGYIKTSYKFELVRPRIIHLKWLPLKKFNKIHYAIYINAFANAGYVTSKDDDIQYQNTMSDTFLGALGIGVDFVTYYDRVLSAFVTRNIQGGMYLGVGFKSAF